MSLIIKHECGYEVDMSNGYIYSCPQCGGVIYISEEQRKLITKHSKSNTNSDYVKNEHIQAIVGLIFLAFFIWLIATMDLATKALITTIFLAILGFLLSHWQFFIGLMIFIFAAIGVAIKLNSLWLIGIEILKELKNTNNSNH